MPFKKRTVKGVKRKLESAEPDEPEPVVVNSGENEKKLAEKANDDDQVATTMPESQPSQPSQPTPPQPVQPLQLSQPSPPASPPRKIQKITTDFQPDVCKDFWQNGYCGYGDTCKFLHLRDELRQKVPLKKDWKVDDEKKLQGVLSQCVLCGNDYKSPVQTECHHVFCKSCFLARFAKTKACAVCDTDGLGVIKPVPKAKLDEMLKEGEKEGKQES